MCRLLLGLFYWFAQYNVFIVNGIIIINQLLILPLRDFFFNPLPEYIQATFSRTGRLQAQELGYIPEADFLAIPTDEKDQAGFIVSNDIEEWAISFKDYVRIRRIGSVD